MPNLCVEILQQSEPAESRVSEQREGNPPPPLVPLVVCRGMMWMCRDVKEEKLWMIVGNKGLSQEQPH